MTSYLALARKWRPRTFSQLIGQDHVNKVLIKSLTQQRLHHAYLFTGTRGVGKTSLARLMTKALNCEKGISATPCLTCDACLAIEQGRFIDLVEIDAASKTRVEDTRDILDNIQYAPITGRYKVYLIDEVHMLSQHSFNALLKTLEEPPEHVKFLLATTDPQKIPATILSRCLQFTLRQVPLEIIATHLQTILIEENYSFEKEAILLLAKAGNGSVRDALSLLDQAIASSDNILCANDIKTLLGYTHQNYALQLLHALIAMDVAQLISISRQIANEGGQFNYVLDELLDYLHQITICQHLPNDNLVFNYSDTIKLLSNKLNAEDVQLWYQIGIKSIEDIPLAPIPSIGFEMMLLRMITFRPISNVPTPPLAHAITKEESSLKPTVLDSQHTNLPSMCRLSAESSNGDNFLEESIANETIFHNNEGNYLQTETVQEVIQSVERPIGVVDKKILPEISDDWDSILKQIKLTGFAQNAAENAELLSKSEHEIVLGVNKGYLSLFTPRITERIEQALATYYDKPIKIILNSSEVVQYTPAQKRHVELNLKQQEAEINLQQDLFLQQLQQEFSAELFKNSIEIAVESSQDRL